MTIKQTYKLSSLLLILVIMIASCGKKHVEPVTFTTYLNNIPFTLPVNSSVGNEILLSKMYATLNVDSAIKSKNASYTISNIQSAEFSECKLTLTDGDNLNNMANFKTLSVLTSSTANTNPTLGAHLPERIDQATYEYSIPKVASNRVTDYLRSNNLIFSLIGVPRRSSANLVNGTASIGIRITIGE